MKSISDTVGKGRRHLATSSTQNMCKKAPADVCTAEKPSIVMKCAGRERSAPVHTEKKLHRRLLTAQKKSEHHARQHDIDSKGIESGLTKIQKYDGDCNEGS